jgi:hypothetical protein
MAEPSRVRMPFRLPERSKKCSRPYATGASYWPSGWRAQRQDDDAPRRAGSRLSIQQDDWPLDRRGIFTSKRQISVNARKFGSHFGKLQLRSAAMPSIQSNFR